MLCLSCLDCATGALLRIHTERDEMEESLREYIPDFTLRRRIRPLIVLVAAHVGNIEGLDVTNPKISNTKRPTIIVSTMAPISLKYHGYWGIIKTIEKSPKAIPSLGPVPIESSLRRSLHNRPNIGSPSTYYADRLSFRLEPGRSTTLFCCFRIGPLNMVSTPLRP